MSKLYFRYAAMNAGKSTALLQVAHNYEERGLRVLLFTAAHDHRAGTGQIGSRLGLVRSAASFGPETEFVFEHLQALAEAEAPAAAPGPGPAASNPHESSTAGAPAAQPGRLACVLIDEAQFLTPEQVRQLHRMAHGQHLPVICWGLRSDFQGVAFPGAAMLLTLADDLEEMKTICACARKATMNIRLDGQGQRVQQGEQVDIGGNDRYRAVCPGCFYADLASGAVAPGWFG